MIDTIITLIGGGLVGCLAWAFALSNKVSAIETRQDGLDKDLDDKIDSLKELINIRFDALDGRQERTEIFLNGHFKRFNSERGH